MKGIDTLDQKILRAIEHTPKSATQLGDVLKEKRTTITYRLRRLERQRLVRSSQAPRKWVLWSKVVPRSSNKATVSLYTGDNFGHCASMYRTLRKGSLIYNIMGTQAVRLSYKKVPEATILESQRMIKQRRLVIKTILHEDALGQTKVASDAVLKALSGRSFGCKGFLSRTLFSGAGEIIVSSSFIIIQNVESRHSVVLRDRHMASLVYEILAMLFDTLEVVTPSRVFDFQKHIDTTLASRVSTDASAQPPQASRGR